MRKIRLFFAVVIILIVILGFTIFYLYSTIIRLEELIHNLRTEQEDLYGFKHIGYPPLSISYYYETNFTVESYADAILNILNVSRQGYFEVFGYGGLIPSSIHVHLSKNSSRAYPRLHVVNNNIYYIVSSDNDLLSPESGYQVPCHVFGLAHELGHMVFMTDDPDFNEGFAIYTAAYRIVPYVYNVLGNGAWPNPYNYSKREGQNYFLYFINNESLCKPGNMYTAAKILYALDQEYGPGIIGEAISIVKNERSKNVFAGYRLSLQYFVDALVQLTNNYSILNLFAENGFIIS